MSKFGIIRFIELSSRSIMQGKQTLINNQIINTEQFYVDTADNEILLNSISFSFSNIREKENIEIIKLSLIQHRSI